MDRISWPGTKLEVGLWKVKRWRHEGFKTASKKLVVISCHVCSHPTEIDFSSALFAELRARSWRVQCSKCRSWHTFTVNYNITRIIFVGACWWNPKSWCVETSQQSCNKCQMWENMWPLPNARSVQLRSKRRKIHQSFVEIGLRFAAHKFEKMRRSKKRKKVACLLNVRCMSVSFNHNQTLTKITCSII